MERCVLDPYAFRQGQVVDLRENGNEPSVSIKHREFLD
jgi:hypothetical protein